MFLVRDVFFIPITLIAKLIMDQREAHQLLQAFESGYVDAHDPALREAERVAGKSVTIKTYNSVSNPHAKVSIRLVVSSRKVRTESMNNGPFVGGAWVRGGHNGWFKPFGAL